MVKIRFNLTQLPDALLGGETVWASPVSSALFRLENIPFHAIGYAQGDIVSCQFVEGGWEVEPLAVDSGNGTVWIYVDEGREDEIGEILSELSSVGCTYERAYQTMYAVNVPSNMDVHFSQLVNYLNGYVDTALSGWEIAKMPSGVEPAK